jgi:hypothetical protein
MKVSRIAEASVIMDSPATRHFREFRKLACSLVEHVVEVRSRTAIQCVVIGRADHFGSKH